MSPPSGLVNWWRAEGDANDSVGTNSGTLYGGTGFAAGMVGQAFSFDGLNDCVTNAQPGITNILDSYTMEFWAWPRAGRASTAEATSGTAGAGNQRYAIYPNWGVSGPAGSGVSVGTNGVSVVEHSSGGYIPTLLVTNIPIVGWTHIAVVYESRQPKLYVNGVLVRVGLTSARASYPSTGLGETGANSGNYGYYSGLLDEVSIYNRSLSPAEVLALYNAGSAGKCRTPPTVSILSPTNGTVILAPASFTLVAEAMDDLGVSHVEFWSDTNSLGVLTNAPWYVPQTNLPPGEYHYTAVAVDIMSLAATSAVSTVTVLSQPPTESQTLVTNGLLVRQTGLFYQTVTVSNPTATAFAALRLWVELDTNSVAHGVRVWNATGQSNGVPYLAYNQSLTPGQSEDLLIEYFVPDRRTLPNPVFRTEVVMPEPPVEPEGTLLASVRQVPLTNGLFLVEFSSIASRIYYVQYSGDMTTWKTALPAIIGTGTRVQWIDNGPPKTTSLPSSEPSRFYRVILLP